MKKSGRTIGADNVRKLEAYLRSVDAIPARGSKANMSAIAEACGFDRQTLYKNPQAKEIILEAIEAKGLKGIDERCENVDAERIALERQLTSLQQTNSVLVAEVYELRARLKKLKHVEVLMENGRRFVP